MVFNNFFRDFFKAIILIRAEQIDVSYEDNHCEIWVWIFKTQKFFFEIISITINEIWSKNMDCNYIYFLANYLDYFFVRKSACIY